MTNRAIVASEALSSSPVQSAGPAEEKGELERGLDYDRSRRLRGRHSAGPASLVIVGARPRGLRCCLVALALALTNEAIGTELGEPLVIALLADWITVAYVFGGLIAWHRRPESAFGPLMIVAGFLMFLSTLSWSTNDIAFTVGQALDMVLPVLFLHVFLAFPDGRLHGRFERTLVAVGYVVAVTLELARMALGGFGEHNLLELTQNAGAAEAVRHVQLLTVSAISLCGVGVLAMRR